MLGFIKTAVMSAFYRVRDEAGQNLVETALIIGVVSLVIIGAIQATDVDAAVTEQIKGVICNAQGHTYAPPAAGSAAGTAGTCS